MTKDNQITKAGIKPLKTKTDGAAPRGEDAANSDASSGQDTPRATQRPDDFDKPKHWTNEPVPEPKAVDPQKDEPRELSPTRYGDWEKDGIAWDF